MKKKYVRHNIEPKREYVINFNFDTKSMTFVHIPVRIPPLAVEADDSAPFLVPPDWSQKI